MTMSDAAEVPIEEQCRSVPKEWRVVVDVAQYASRNVPYGRMLHDAADAIASLRAERDALRHDIERHVAIAAEECARGERAEADAASDAKEARRKMTMELWHALPLHTSVGTLQGALLFGEFESDIRAAIAAEKESHS